MGPPGPRPGKRYTTGEDSNVTFADVAGLEEAIAELKEVRDFLKHPETFERLGAKPPAASCSSVPPGAARPSWPRPWRARPACRSSRCRPPRSWRCWSASAVPCARPVPEGQGGRPVDRLRRRDRRRGPHPVVGLHEPEGESTLNELLIQLDGFDTAQRVVLMAATNRADILDSALMRKGRFDRQVVIDVPNKAGRLAIFKVHSRGKPVAPDVDLERFAGRTVGLSGADIAAVMNEAATLAARRRLNSIGNSEISEGIDRVISGAELHSHILSPDEKRRVAYHEAGHTLMGWVLNSAVTVEKVSIVARGHALGLTWSLPIEDRRLKTRSQMEEEITAALAGLAAEMVVYDDPSGARSPTSSGPPDWPARWSTTWA